MPTSRHHVPPRVARLLILILALSPLACSPALPPAAAVPPMATVPADAPASEHYVHESIALRPRAGHPDDFDLVEDGRIVTEPAFRERYAKIAASGDLDALLRDRAKKKVWVLAAGGAGLMALGGGAVALTGTTTSDCAKSPGCTRGIASALLLAGGGAYMLGCAVLKGYRCILDGDVGMKGAGLKPEEAAHFVTRYDAALARSLRWAPQEMTSRSP